MNLDDKFKKMKKLIDEGNIVFPKLTKLPKFKKVALGEFIPHGLCGNNVGINVYVFDEGTANGYKLNLLTGKYYKPNSTK